MWIEADLLPSPGSILPEFIIEGEYLEAFQVFIMFGSKWVSLD